MARAYKLTKSNGEGPQYPGFNYAFHSIFTADEMCTDVNLQCAAGVNLATFRWCLNNKYGGERLFLMEFSTMPENVCVPVGSNGKFRVKKCRKVGECDWNGRLLSKTTKPEAE